MKLILFIILFALFVIWSTFVEPNILTVKHIKVQNEKLKGLKIVFVSDFHYKPYETKRLKRDVEKINAQNADIILLGGDFVNGHKRGQSLDIEVISKEFQKLKSKYGTFAVLGNHDCWQDAAKAEEELSKNGITVLKNSNKKAGEVYIAGVEDLQTQNPDVKKALSGTSSPVILLTHTPDIIEDIPNSVTLTLAGHLHGGQFRLPLAGAVIAPSKYGTKYTNGMSETNGKKMFVTKGIGTSILPIRFLCFPEIVIIEFI